MTFRLCLVLPLLSLLACARAAPPAPASPGEVERGAYLTEHLLQCFSCHGELDTGAYSYPVKAGTRGKGVCHSNESGTFCTPNLTPAALSSWSDDEIVEAIRNGVAKGGRRLTDQMPSAIYRTLGDEDVRAVVAYLRSLPPIEQSLPKNTLELPPTSLARVTSVTAPSRQDEVAYGAYLAKIALCEMCHTAQSEPRQPFAGGEIFEGEGGLKVAAANLTPHPENGLTSTRAEFVLRFRGFASLVDHPVPAGPSENTVMPWVAFAGISEADLGALHAYLGSLPAVSNPVEKRPK